MLDLYSSLVVYFKFSREFQLYDIACYHAIRYDAIKEVNVVLVLLDKSIIITGCLNDYKIRTAHEFQY